MADDPVRDDGSRPGGDTRTRRAVRPPPTSIRHFPERVVAGELSEFGGLPLDMLAAQTTMPFCLADPTEPDCPIVFVNRAFCELTGYAMSEAVGRNCRFMQGPDTDPATVRQLHEAVSSGSAVAVDILNYRKNGTSFWNALHVGPVFDERRELRYFFSTQWDVSSVRVARERSEHARTLARALKQQLSLSMATMMHVIQSVGRAYDAPQEARRINERFLAITRGYEACLAGDDMAGTTLRDAVRRIVEPYDRAVRITGDPDTRITPHVAGILAVALHHFASSSARQPTARSGARLEADAANGYVVVRWIEPAGGSGDGAGHGRSRDARILDDVLGAAGGRIEYDREGDDSIATIVLREWG